MAALKKDEREMNSSKLASYIATSVKSDSVLTVEYIDTKVAIAVDL